jgi:hypothetical protein
LVIALQSLSNQRSTRIIPRRASRRRTGTEEVGSIFERKMRTWADPAGAAKAVVVKAKKRRNRSIKATAGSEERKNIKGEGQ